jgi:hypothetical protein
MMHLFHLHEMKMLVDVFLCQLVNNYHQLFSSWHSVIPQKIWSFNYIVLYI